MSPSQFCARRLWVVGRSFAAILTLTTATFALATAPCGKGSYQVGAAMDDITGPIAEVGMMGYADTAQVDEGLHMRLYSRALVVSDGCGQATVAMVINDLSMIFHGLRAAVLAALAQEIPGVFHEDNLLVSATHSHAGPGGYGSYGLYNITSFGFSRENFEAIVSGTTRAIVKAYRQQAPARLTLARRDLPGYQFNRSPEAYRANPAGERQHFASDTDPEMALLKVTNLSGKPVAAFNWFPVHGVSLSMSNKLVSGDNKGLAAYLFEEAMGNDHGRGDGAAPTGFVAGFVQANAGDVSPYDVSKIAWGQPFDPEDHGMERNEASGRGQFHAAAELLADATEVIDGPVGAVHRFVMLPERPVSAAYADGPFEGTPRLCHAGFGVSFAAGTKNGQPLPIFQTGTIYGKNWPAVTLMPAEQACHLEKALLLPVGMAPVPGVTPRVAPFQIVRIGQLAIIGAPFEITTMAGRRLKEQVLRTLAPAGVTQVVIAALANEYLHYVTTRDEYRAQGYEGGSTLFGPHSLAAYTEIFDHLAAAMRDGAAVADDAAPEDFTDQQLQLKPGVWFDAPPVGHDFGDIKQDAAPSYRAGELATVEFWGAHPNNGAAPHGSYLAVEQQGPQGWRRILADSDPSTTLHWRREGIASSVLTAAWKITAAVQPGTYRLCHQGLFKEFVTGNLKPYAGCSTPFVVARG